MRSYDAEMIFSQFDQSSKPEMELQEERNSVSAHSTVLLVSI